MKSLVAIAVILSAIAAPALAQDQATYKIMAIQDSIMLIGQKPYLTTEPCPDFQPGDVITFSEDPITCLTVTAINIENLKECQLKCVANSGYPDPIDNPTPGPN
jgi:hypothetical protein